MGPEGGHATRPHCPSDSLTPSRTTTRDDELGRETDGALAPTGRDFGTPEQPSAGPGTGA